MNLVLGEGTAELLAVEGVLAGDAEALLGGAQHAPRDSIACIVQATVDGTKLSFMIMVSNNG